MVHIFLVPSPGRYGISTFDISTFEKYRYRQFLCGEPYPDVRFRSHPNTRTWVLGCRVSNRNEVLFWKPLDGKLWFSRNNSAVKMENFPGKGIRNKQVSDTEFSINFTIYEKAFIPNWTSVERRLLSISWKKITQSAPTHPPRYLWYEWNFPAGENILQKPLVFKNSLAIHSLWINTKQSLVVQ